MAERDVAVSKRFEVHGVWWAPDASEHFGDRAAGTLTYEPETGFTLTVLDWYRTPEPPQRLPVVHGETLTGVRCTLFEVISIGHTMGIGGGGGHSYEQWHSNSLFHGVHVASPDELLFDHAVVAISGLRDWLAQPWKDGAGGGVPGLGRGEREELEVSLPGGRLILAIGPAKKRQQFETTQRVVARASFRLDEAVTVRQFRERFSGPLEDLLVFSAQEPTVEESMTVLLRSEQDQEAWWQPTGAPPQAPARHVEVVERTHVQWPTRNPKYNRLLIYPAALGDAAPAAIARWYELWHELGGAGNVLSGVLNSSRLNLENRLLNLMTFAEAYHRTFFNEPAVPPDDHKRMVEAMLDEIEEEHRTWYRDRLAYAWEQSQKMRLRGLIDRASEVMEAVGEWRELLPKQLVDTRNHLTHFSHKGKHVVEEEAQYLALQRLTMSIEINLMRDIGMDEQRIERSVRQGHVWEQLF